jgi:hypothetical protein
MNVSVALVITNPTQLVLSQMDVRSERYCDLFESPNRKKKMRVDYAVRTDVDLACLYDDVEHTYTEVVDVDVAVLDWLTV